MAFIMIQHITKKCDKLCLRIFGSSAAAAASARELEEIFLRTFGSSENRERKHFLRKHASDTPYTWRPTKRENLEECLLVDGYNIIFAWDELKELAKVNIDGARGRLLDILSNYQGYKKNHLIVVFDAYKVPGGRGSVQKYHNIYVVYTKEAETADQYIEKTVQEIAKKHRVTVATSDALEQMIIIGQGAHRISARDLRDEIAFTNQMIREEHLQKTGKSGQYLFDVLSDEMAEFMDDVRMGRKEFHEIEKLNLKE